MTKYVELLNNLKSMIGGIRMKEVDGVLHTNFNDSVNIFKSSDWGIVELGRIKNLLNKMNSSDIYHPNTYINSHKITNMEDLTKDQSVVEAYENKKSVFRCGIINGSYKEVIIDTFNKIVQNKVKEKVDLVVAEKMNLSHSLVDMMFSKGQINETQHSEMKAQITQKYEQIVSDYNLGLKLAIKQYCVFTKDQELLPVNSIVQNLILDTEFFAQISLINNEDIIVAKELGIEYDIKPSFAILSEVKMAA